MSQVGRYALGSGSGAPVETLTGNTGGPVGPDAAFNINVIGDGTTIEVAGNPGTNTLTISATEEVAIQYDTDAGSAVPVGGILNVFGGSNINTAGAGNTVTINLNDIINLPITNAGGTQGQIQFGSVRWISQLGTGNTFVGGDSGNLTLTTGSATGNSAFGFNSFQNVTTGTNNTALGATTLAITSGGYNTAVGIAAGSNYTTTESSNIVLGNVGTALENNTIRIGTQGAGLGQQNRFFAAGIDGVNVGSVVRVVTEASGQLGTADITAGSGITVTPSANAITISTTGSVATSYPTDAGTATPAAGILNVFGGTAGRDINTTGAGDTINIELNNSITLGDLSALGAGVDALTATTGDITITAGNLNLPTTASANAGVVEVNSTRFIHSFGGTNTFVGASAGNFTMTGFSSVGIGSQALEDVTSGAFNVAIGFLSQSVATTGSNNVSVGAATLGAAIGAAAQNTAIGANALNLATTPNNNIVIGYLAGSNLATTESDNIIIGNTAVVADNARIRIGTNGTQTSAFIVGIDGVNVGSTAKVVTMGTAGTADQLGTATITAGGGITVTSAANTITISADNAGFVWTVVTTGQTFADNLGFFTNDAGVVTIALPTTSSVGDTYQVAAMSAGGWLISQSAGQQIRLGNVTTSSGAGGSLSSTDQGDWVTLVCSVANTNWVAKVEMGNITVV